MSNFSNVDLEWEGENLFWNGHEHVRYQSNPGQNTSSSVNPRGPLVGGHIDRGIAPHRDWAALERFQLEQRQINFRRNQLAAHAEQKQSLPPYTQGTALSNGELELSYGTAFNGQAVPSNNAAIAFTSDPATTNGQHYASPRDATLASGACCAHGQSTSSPVVTVPVRNEHPSAEEQPPVVNTPVRPPPSPPIPTPSPASLTPAAAATTAETSSHSELPPVPSPPQKRTRLQKTDPEASSSSFLKRGEILQGHILMDSDDDSEPSFSSGKTRTHVHWHPPGQRPLYTANPDYVRAESSTQSEMDFKLATAARSILACKDAAVPISTDSNKACKLPTWNNYEGHAQEVNSKSMKFLDGLEDITALNGRQTWRACYEFAFELRSFYYRQLLKGEHRALLAKMRRQEAEIASLSQALEEARQGPLQEQGEVSRMEPFSLLSGL